MSFQKLFLAKNFFLAFLILSSFILSLIYLPSPDAGAACFTENAIALNNQTPNTSIIFGTNLYVLSTFDVSVIDTTSNTLIETINIGGQAVGVWSVLHIVGNNLYVINSGSDSVNIIDMLTNSVIGSITVGDDPTSGALVGSDLYVTNRSSGTVSVIDTNTNTVTDTVSIGALGSLLYLFGTDLYIGNNINAGTTVLSIVDTLTSTLTTTLNLSAGVLNFNTNGSVVYALKPNHTIEIIDPVTKTSIDIINIFPPLLSPTHSVLIGTDLYISGSSSNNVVIFDTDTNTVTDTISVETQPIFMNLVGSDLYVSNFASSSISVIDTNTNELKVTCVPELITSEINGNILTLTYDEILDDSSVPGGVSFIVTINGVQVDISNVQVLDDKVILTTSVRANYGDTVTLSYVVPVQNPTQNSSGNNALPITDEIVINNTTTCAIINVGSGTYSGTLVGNNLYVNNPDSLDISVINTLNYQVVETIDVGANVYYSTLSGTDLYVFGYGLETIVLDTETNTITETIANSEGYFSGTLVGTDLYINNLDTGEVYVLDTLINTVGDIITVGSGPYSGTLVGTDLYIFNSGEDTVSVIDTNTNTVTGTATVGASPFSGTLVGTDLYVNNYGDATVSVIDTLTKTVSETISLSSGPQFSVFTDGKLYVSLPDENSISAIDTSDNSVIDTYEMSHDADGFPAFLNLVNGNIYVSNAASMIYIIDPSTNTLLSDCPSGFNLSYTAGAGGYILGDTSQTVNSGEDGTPVTAVPNSGYEFIGWSDNSSDNPRTDLNVTSNISVTANFSLREISVTQTRTSSGTTVHARFLNLIKMGKTQEAYKILMEFPHMFPGGETICRTETFTDFMKIKDVDGKFSLYNSGVVKEISKLQSFINKIFIFQYVNASGPVDGIFGPLTKRGVERLQSLLNKDSKLEKDLAVDGIVGPYTRSAINDFCLPDYFQS